MNEAPLARYVRQRQLSDRFWFNEMVILEEVYSHYNATRDPSDRPKVMALRFSIAKIERVIRMMGEVPEVTTFQHFPCAPLTEVSKYMHQFHPVCRKYESEQHRNNVHYHLEDLWFVSSNLVWESLGEAIDWVDRSLEEIE